MKRWLLLLILLPCISFGQQTYVPDDNFEQALINLGYDTGPLDDTVLTANISSVSNLLIGFSNISDLTGIEDFAALSDLSCWGNQLTTLDVSQNTNLIQLDCSANPLTSLNVTGLTALLWMYTDFCQLTSLDVSTNISLEELDFEVNQISSIDLSNNTALISLYCTLNQLTSLDLSLNTALEFLMCRDNQLTCLNLKNIDQQNMTGFIAYNNPCLYCIEVDDPIWATANWTPSGMNIDPIASFSVNCSGNCVSSGNVYPLTMDICQGDSIFLEGSFQTNIGTYYDTLLNINSCDSIIVTALTVLPVSTNAISYDICQGDSLLVGGVYQNVAGTYIDSLTTINSCDSIVTTILSVLQNTDATITSDSIFCENDPITTLLANTIGGTWTGIGITNSFDGTFDPGSASGGAHQIIYTISGSCGDADTVNIIVNEIPVLSSIFTDDSCSLSDGSIDLNVTGGSIPYDYLWSNGSITEDVFEIATGIYWVIVSDDNDCAESDTITIGDDLSNCSGDLWVPNIFSPNNDTYNDILYVRGAETASEFLFIIFNRWGEKVFESSNPNTGWDGTFDGKEMNDAVFVYLVTATIINGSEASIKGTVTLVK